jgi:ABC-2 type transport system permease protein
MENTSLNRIMTVLRKEWMEIRQQRALVLTLLLPPLLFAFLPVAAMFFMANAPIGELQDMKEMSDAMSSIYPALRGMTDEELAQALIGQQMSVLFFLMPIILPSVIASYSIVGEKTGQTLEPLLATPIKTWELLVAKSLSALVPSVVATWASAAIYVPLVAIVSVSPRVFTAVVSPGWILVLLLCSPLLALITIALTMAVSSRVNDPRTAQQISAIMILPIMLVFFGQLIGFLALSPLVAIVGSVVLAFIAVVILWITTYMFQRDSILTRWS